VRELLTRYFTRVNVKPEEDLLRYARELDRHYIPSRYPNAHPSGTPHEAYDEETSERALNVAERVIAFVRGIIGV
jgi:HEPN domain-containing protein